MKLPKHIEWAWEYVGGLSSPSKMPCFSYSIPAKECNTGSKLRAVEGSVCHKCYAYKGFYNYPNAKNALAKRFNSLYLPRWVEAMTLLISTLEYSGHFRWHDSGDINSLIHFKNIIDIATNLPNINFWLPTKEQKLVFDYVRIGNIIPKNLTIRISGYLIDQLPPNNVKNAFVVSGVSSNEENVNCPASKQNNKCLTCRACWNCEVPIVWYKKH